MILPICALVDKSKYLDILTLDFLNNVGASSNLTSIQTDTASAFVLRIPVLIKYPCLFRLSFESSFYNVTSEYDPALVLLILKFQLRILKMTKIRLRHWNELMHKIRVTQRVHPFCSDVIFVIPLPVPLPNLFSQIRRHR